MNIVFTFLYAVFYICHHPLGFLKHEELLTSGAAIIMLGNKSSVWTHVF